jgi:hypothetical protein
MATTQHRTAESTATYDGRDDRPRLEIDHASETRRAFKTTEFFAMLAGVAALLIAGYASDDSLNVFRTWTLVTVVVSAYIVSRGFAKAGSYDRRADIDVRDRH